MNQKFLTERKATRILDDMKPLFQMLHEWRTLLHLSPSEAAKRCQVSNQQWYELESGATKDPRASTIRKLADGTGIPLERLVEATAHLVPA